MSRLNKIFLVGKVFSAVNQKSTPAGDSVSDFQIEVSRRNPEANQQTDVFTIIAWGEQSEKAASLNLGDLVHVEGSIRNRTYENNEGRRVYVTEIEARTLACLSTASVGQQSVEQDDNFPGFNNPPVIEPSQNAAPNFDFNEAIQNDSSAELSEEVPF